MLLELEDKNEILKKLEFSSVLKLNSVPWLLASFFPGRINASFFLFFFVAGNWIIYQSLIIIGIKMQLKINQLGGNLKVDPKVTILCFRFVGL